MGTLAQVEFNAEPVLAKQAATPVIAVEDVHKYYNLGETKVHALR